MQKIFDGHNDVLLRLWRHSDVSGSRFIKGDGEGHVDLPRARAGGLAAGFFAVYVPGNLSALAALVGDEDDGSVVDLPHFGPVDASDARRVTLEQAGILLRMARENPNDFRVCTTVAEIEAAAAVGAFAAIFHIEGAEAIGPDLGTLDVLYAAGLRSIGPVWSRPNAFGTGIPFRFPGSPEEGPGLTPAGKDLLQACNRLGILFDLSHLNAAGFRDVAALSDKPLVATHSNAHALSAASRNLTDDQLRVVAESRGVVGLNYAVGFLRDDGRRSSDTALTTMIRHVDHLLALLGEEGVALGSDFDGALIPREIGDVAGLPALVGAMRQAGYGEALIEKICWSNWLDVLCRTFVIDAAGAKGSPL